MKSVAFAVGLLAMGGTAFAAPASALDYPTNSTRPGLNSLMKLNDGRYFGTAASAVHFNDSKWLSVLQDSDMFGSMTPENSQKWEATEPERGLFDFAAADLNVQKAQEAGQMVRCHTLIWYNGLPDWITSQTWTNETLIAVMENHIKEVVTHFKGQCYSWDVVNEAVNDDGSYRETIWYNTIGPEYIAMAYNMVAKYDPDAKLYYNDYGIEFINNKTLGAIALVKDLKEKGVKVDGVGIQGHYPVVLAPSYEDQVEVLQRFADLGVEVATTELDVFVEIPEKVEQVAMQTAIYADSVRACVDVPACIGVTVWGFYDPYSWVPGTVPGYGNADLFWANWTAKPAYDAIVNALLPKE
ncbi:uncharacterized protein JN550_002713 [Neoarthrinium moseri]|uniref:uncharacterized protein n=1 Tax=Neoarthrinium moseri TaxID=1658444 RepID=UPI001FDCF998|nr:uncharacterized protein JN550_002713 [Neoarthrinium moseri]KAI1874134.1 hypothetical protein JN550_002713 [Neoarthrinium moseri]